MRRVVYLVCLLIAGVSTLPAQSLAGERNLDRALILHLGYGPFASAGDLEDRFGSGFAFDAGLAYSPLRSSWQFGLLARYGFGNEVKEDVLADLRTSAGFIIGNQREPADVQLRQRQLFVGPRVGYTLALGDNQRAGLQLTTAIGYFYSRIRIQEDPVQFVPQIEQRLQAGYDRLAGGPSLYQFIGYQQLAADRRFNFYLGADLTVAFTQSLRDYSFTGGDNDSRTDLTFGLRAGVILPLYRGEGQEIFY